MHSMRPTKAFTALATLAATLAVSPVMASGLNMTPGVTETSKAVYDLHMIIMWVCVIIGILVFGAMAYSMYAHRKSRGVTPATFHESTTLEVIWTVIPFAILIGMAIPSTKVLVDMHDVSEPEMTVKVTGYQWKWEYEYIEDGVRFFSTIDRASNEARQLNSGIDVNTVENYLVNVDKPLVIPAGKKVRFLLTANDVNHAWWVPEFGWKKDAIPGFINEAWTKVDEPGTYRGKCAELCGRDHAFMPIVVEVKSEADYKQWLAAAKSDAQTQLASAVK